MPSSVVSLTFLFFSPHHFAFTLDAFCFEFLWALLYTHLRLR
jgi:hypothetical protein